MGSVTGSIYISICTSICRLPWILYYTSSGQIRALRFAVSSPLFLMMRHINTCNTSGLDSFSTPQLFYTYFYNHARRLRLEKLLYIWI